MTGADLKSIRLSVAPGVTQGDFARSIGYVDADAYRKYESGARPIPHLLELLMQAMAETGWRPS